MSTITLLDPTVRIQRRRRRDAIRDLRTQAYASTGATQIQLRGVLAKLETVRKTPCWPGWFKEREFFRIVGRFYANVHKFAERAEERRVAAELARHKAADEPWYRKLAKKAKAMFGRE